MKQVLRWFSLAMTVALVAFALLAARAGVLRLAVRWPAWSRYLAPYAIGTVAMFWVIERVGGF